MTILEAIQSRHSVRRYTHRPLTDEQVSVLMKKVEECNRLGHLHIQLIQHEPKAFTGVLSYGKFSGVENYLVMAGKEDDNSNLDERIGYYGEQLVLLAQQLGLNTCWVGLSYRKVADTFTLEPGEKVACVIAVGYGESGGAMHKLKSLTDVSNVSVETPEWFRRGVEAALLAPTAINQQKFHFEYLRVDGRDCVRARRKFSLVGYTHMDLGIAKLHFEIGAGKGNFTWI